MAGREVTGVVPAFNEHFTLACGERLHHDLSRVPVAWRPYAEQH